MYSPVEEPIRNPECLAHELRELKGDETRTTWRKFYNCIRGTKEKPATGFKIEPAPWDDTKWERIMGGNLARSGQMQREFAGITGKWKPLGVILMVAHCGALRDEFDQMMEHVERALRCWLDGYPERPGAAPITPASGAATDGEAQGTSAGLVEPPDRAWHMVDQVRSRLAPQVPEDTKRHYIELVYANAG